ncbi:MAG: peptidoglycan editing factor PgeF [Thermoflexia bacterium]|nr:MAG: peptidoglycan editing factor PgeF [Thermoflexia bacterium]
MERVTANGIVYYRFESLAGAGVTHAFLTRLGGVSRGPYATLNLGHTVGDDLDAVQENHRRVLALFGLRSERVVSPYQVHSAHVRPVGPEHGGTVQSQTDGLLTRTPGLALLFRFADCAPIVLFDPVRRAVGLVHAGWRGVARGIVRAAVEAFVRWAESRPPDLWAGIGPTIGPCCYEVGPEVVEAVRRTSPPDADIVRRQDGRLYLDLPGAVAAQLTALGVRQVEQSGLCTACHTDEWFSHRAEGGRTGRFGTLVMLE